MNNDLTTNIFINVPIEDVDDKYPVVIYSPGFGCDRDLTIFIIEKLVQQGYVVITLGSPHETSCTIMPNVLLKRHASTKSLGIEERLSWYENLEDRNEADILIKEDIDIVYKMAETQKALYEFLEDYKSFVKIENSTHMTFCDEPILLNQEYEECLGGKILIKTAHEIISTVTVKFLNEFLCNSADEYKNFIKYENTYEKLKEIDANGEIK